MKRMLVVLFTVVAIFGFAGMANALPVALTPAQVIDVSTGTGIGSGAVSTGHDIFSFDAFAGDIITLDIDVTAILPGTYFTDDDSMLFLFDSTGMLIAENDDDEDSLQSLIENFIILSSGTYYVGVTTYYNVPILDGSGIITGWYGGGASNIEYDLIISGVTPSAVPEPGTVVLLGTGLAGLAFARRRMTK